MGSNNLTLIKMFELLNNLKQNKKTEPADILSPEIEAVNITLLLKSLGLQLNKFDFEQDQCKDGTSSKNGSQDDNENDLVVNIKCNKSGIRSVLSHKITTCTCPLKTASNDSTFWEVQGTSSKVNLRDSSSNLLPDMSEHCSLASKAILTNLLGFYQNNVNDPKPVSYTTASYFGASPKYRSSRYTPPAEGKSFTVNSDTVENSRNPMGSFAERKGDELMRTSNEGGKKTFQINENIEEKLDTKEVKIEYVAEGDTADEKCFASVSDVKKEVESHSLSPPKNSIELPAIQLTEVPEKEGSPYTANTSNSEIENEHNNTREIEKLEMNPTSPIEPPNADMDRDINVIQALEGARKYIDTALLHMKLNLTQDLSRNSIMTTTPQCTSRDKAKSTLTEPRQLIRSSTLHSLRTGTMKTGKLITPTRNSPNKSLRADPVANNLLVRHLGGIRRSLQPSTPISGIKTPQLQRSKSKIQPVSKTSTSASVPFVKNKFIVRTGMSDSTPFNKLIKHDTPRPAIENKASKPKEGGSIKKPLKVESKVGSFRSKSSQSKDVNSTASSIKSAMNFLNLTSDSK